MDFSKVMALIGVKGRFNVINLPCAMDLTYGCSMKTIKNLDHFKALFTRHIC